MARTKTTSYHPAGEDYWEIPDVKYKGDTEIWGVCEKMTPSVDYVHLAEIYNQEKPKGNPHPANSMLNFAIFDAGTRLKSKIAHDEFVGLMRFIQKGLAQFPNTLTMINYCSSSNIDGEKPDRIIHNHGASDEFFYETNLVGEDGEIGKIPDKNNLELLLGNKNIKRINNITNTINRTPMYLGRLNSKPSENEKKVVRFGAGPYRLDLGCHWDPSTWCPAFRVFRID
ncbi:MAG: hypothetical protein KKA64_01600 [Nanoarchaeota archaeon]|nr:hypothetical protein [Nanoarchaeota archaeon]